MLPTPPYFTPVAFSYPNQTPRQPISHTIIEFTSSYLSLNPREIVVVQCNSNDQPIFFDLKPSEGRPPWFLTTLKVLSYCTIILPILALASNLFFRSYLNLRTLPLQSTLFDQHQSTLFKLPNEILSIILKNVGMADRSAFALTCKKGKNLVQNTRATILPKDFKSPKYHKDPFLTVRCFLETPLLNRLEEVYFWMRENTKALRLNPHLLIPREGAQALTEGQSFLLQEAALHLLTPDVQKLRGNPQSEHLTERPFSYLEINVDPRSWFGWGDLTVLQEDVSRVILERIKQISEEQPLLPVQVSLTGRAERALPIDFTLQLVIALANHHFFIDVNGTVNENNVPERLRGYLGSLSVWPDPAYLAENIKPAFEYLNKILRKQLQLQEQ